MLIGGQYGNETLNKTMKDGGGVYKKQLVLFNSKKH